MGRGPSPPPAPDPRETASAQTATNIGTAIANQRGALVNQVTPYGTLRFDQTGTFQYSDPLEPDAAPYQIPTYTATQTFTPIGQQISNNTTQTELNLARLGNSQSARLNNLLDRPVQLGNEAVEGRIADLQRKRMDPLFAERRDALETRLANQGIKRGTDAYSRAMSDFGETENDAYNQMFLTGRAQAINEQLTERNQPLNEIAALMSGSQVSQPTFVGTPAFNAPTTDFAGITNAAYQQDLARWNAQQANSGFPIGGLFSALGSIGAAAFSDRRLKRDILPLGLLGDLPIYAWRYIWGGPMHVGVMAQDMLALRPEAVIVTPSGYLAVDYGRI